MEKTDFNGLLEKLLYLLEEEKVYTDRAVDFPELCRRLGVPAGEMDGYLMDVLGTSGTDILEAYRRGVPLCML